MKTDSANNNKVSDENEKPKNKKNDVLLVHSPIKNQDGFHVIRAREGNVEVGEMRSIKEGEPLRGEVVKLKQRSEHERLFDVEVLASREDMQPMTSQRGGPAQVATDLYRQNWDSIFKKTPKSKEFLN